MQRVNPLGVPEVLTGECPGVVFSGLWGMTGKASLRSVNVFCIVLVHSIWADSGITQQYESLGAVQKALGTTCQSWGVFFFCPLHSCKTV